MVTCEVGSITAGGMPVSLAMGDGGGDVVTAEVKGDSPIGTAGDRGCVVTEHVRMQVCQYNDPLNIPHSTLTDHYYRLPSFVSV